MKELLILSKLLRASLMHLAKLYFSYIYVIVA